MASALSRAQPPAAGREPGSYARLCELATGGMASVDLVVRREGSFARLYAMKRLLPHLRADESVRAMFLDEARFAGLLRHPNVVSVLDVGQDADGPYLVMDYVEGVPLSELMRELAGQRVELPLQLALEIAAQIAAGLHAAHELVSPDGSALRLVHRDVSPQNVLVGFDGAVKVADFGIAKALGQSTRTATGVLKGKFGYMSPEQLRFDEPDRRSDLFALGVVTFELLAGRRLYVSRTGTDAAKRILSEPPPDITDDRPDTPAEVVQLLFSLLAKDPAERPHTALEVVRALEATLTELSAEEGRLDLGEFVLAHFGQRRQERAEVVRKELAALDAAPVVRASAPAPRSSSHRPRWLAAALLASVTLGAGALALSLSDRASNAAPARNLPSTVSIRIDSAPAGAAVFIDDQPHGQTPIEVELESDARVRQVRVEKAGYVPMRDQLIASEPQRLRYALVASPPTPASAEAARPATLRAPERRPARPAAAARPDPVPAPSARSFPIWR